MEVVPGASLMAQQSRICLPRQEMWVRSPGWEDSPGGGHGNMLQSSCLENCRGRRSLAGCSPGCRRVGHDWARRSAQVVRCYLVCVLSLWIFEDSGSLGSCLSRCNQGPRRIPDTYWDPVGLEHFLSDEKPVQKEWGCSHRLSHGGHKIMSGTKLLKWGTGFCISVTAYCLAVASAKLACSPRGEKTKKKKNSFSTLALSTQSHWKTNIFHFQGHCKDIENWMDPSRP